MTKKEIIELYLADLNNLVPDSEAKRSRIIDLEDELEALRIHDVVGRSEQLLPLAQYIYEHQNNLDGKTAKDYLQDFLSQ